jgi:hypothetical protein
MEFILNFIAEYPIASSVLVVVGVLRAIFKPIMTAIEAVVAATPTQKDDLALEKAKASKLYLALVWFIDYIASVKLPK